MAKLIYGKVDSRSGKIYQYLRELDNLGYLQREKMRYSVKTEKIVDEIEKYLSDKEVSLDQEQKEILFHLLESATVGGYLRLMTSELVQNKNTKNGGFLADLFTRLSMMAMGIIDESRLEQRKPDLKKECRALNEKINELELSTELYTIEVLFREKITELDIQYFKKLKNYVHYKEKLNANKKKMDSDTQYLLFHVNYMNKALSLVPLELLKKLQFLNYIAAMVSNRIMDNLILGQSRFH